MPSPNSGQVPEWTTSDRLRKAREHAGFDQIAFSATTGISRATISAAENGRTQPSRATLRMWAMATGVPVMWIETGCTPWDLNPEPTDYGFDAIATVVDIDSARSLRAPVIPLDAA